MGLCLVEKSGDKVRVIVKTTYDTRTIEYVAEVTIQADKHPFQVKDNNLGQIRVIEEKEDK